MRRTDDASVRRRRTRLEGTRRRFERWRATCEGRTRIPEALWASAVKAAGKYGVYPTSRALRLDYYSLKKRVEAAGLMGESAEGGSRRASGRPSVARSAAGEIRRGEFIELAMPASAGPPSTSVPECILELEDPRGAKMRIHLKGTSAPDLAALSRSFWGSAEAAYAEGVGA